MNFEQIKNLYENYDEDGRLFRDKAHLPEYLTTIRYFDRLFKPGSKILDACAGTGIYSLYLADKGHYVTTCDLLEHNIYLIKSNPKADKLYEISICNVLDMTQFENNYFDVVLCMGAMYHLSTDEEKIQAIRNCISVCKPNGLVILSYLNYFAVIAAEVQKGLVDLDEIIASFADDSNNVFKATTPTKMEQYAEIAGLEKLHNIGVDGISYVIRDKVNDADDETFAKWMDYIYEHCEEPSTIGYCMHGLLIGKKRT